MYYNKISLQILNGLHLLKYTKVCLHKTAFIQFYQKDISITYNFDNFPEGI